jgi:hypothetical protein
VRFTYGTGTWLFLRILGIVYVIAFASLAVQIVPLVGPHGIVPGPAWATAVVLRSLTIGGAGVALLVVGGIAPIPALLVLWIDYLVLSNIGAEFLSYQWDALLLETGLLALLVAPLVWRERLDRLTDPPRLSRALMLWLLFRLMVGSGVVKLASGDPTWRNLTAMTFHYETQPIPTPLAWYANQLPLWFQKLSTLLVFAVEILAPLAMFGPRRVRVAGFCALVGLQALIALTGNYAFFNLLSAALCLFLLGEPGVERRGVQRGAAVGYAVLTVPVSLAMFLASCGVDFAPPPIVLLADTIAPVRSVNSYGLFAVMTTTRDEIVVEGSSDGVTWLPYEFRYKPGEVSRRPPWVAPHQPRLDWQMWFASLTTFDTVPWFQTFCLRLLEGTPDVLALLAHNPFPDRPPRYVRGGLYRYHFGRDTWWTREPIGAYSPVMEIQRGQSSQRSSSSSPATSRFSSVAGPGSRN